MSGDDVVVMQEATRDLEKEFGLTHRGSQHSPQFLSPLHSPAVLEASARSWRY